MVKAKNDRPTKENPIDFGILMFFIAIVVVIVIIYFSLLQTKGFEVNVNIPQNAKVSELFEISVLVKQKDVMVFDISQMLPLEWKIVSWSVEGNNSVPIYKAEVVTYNNEIRNLCHWSFSNELGKELKITYTVEADTVGNGEIITLWTYPRNFDSVIHNVVIG